MVQNYSKMVGGHARINFGPIGIFWVRRNFYQFKLVSDYIIECFFLESFRSLENTIDRVLILRPRSARDQASRLGALCAR